jgi:hypothetical protein
MKSIKTTKRAIKREDGDDRTVHVPQFFPTTYLVCGIDEPYQMIPFKVKGS